MPPWILWVILGAIPLLLALLLSTKFKITVGYTEEVTLRVGVGLLRLTILPWRWKKKKQRNGPRSMSEARARRIRRRMEKRAAKKVERKKPQPPKAKKKKKAAEEPKAPAKEPRKLTPSEILGLLDLVRVLITTVVRRFCKHLRIDIARLRIRIATGDAAVTAVAYGAITQSVNVLLPILRKVKNFGLPSNTNFDIQPDFLGESSEVDVRISFSIRLWQILHIGLDGIFSVVRHKFSQLL